MTSVQPGSWKANGLISSGQCDQLPVMKLKWMTLRCLCTFYFAKESLSYEALEKVMNDYSRFLTWSSAFPSLHCKSPENDSLSYKPHWCLEEESGECGAESRDALWRFPTLWSVASYRIVNCQQFYFNSCSGKKCFGLQWSSLL